MDKEQWLEEHHSKMLARPVRWRFPPIPDTPRLTFERLTRENAERCWTMFVGDTNPFLDEYFVDREKFEDYLGHLCDYMPRSTKYGGADWLISLRSTDAAVADVGVLHVYDLSLENYSDIRERATIGFATASVFRRRGVMREAVPHFVQYIARELGRTRILAYTNCSNVPCIALLRSLDFTPCDEDFSCTENHYFRYIAQFNV